MIELIISGSATVVMDSLSTVLAVVQSAADSVSTTIQNYLGEVTVDSVLTAIRQFTGETASHTERSFVWDQVCLLGLVSLGASFLTIVSIWRQERLTPTAYRALLYDLVRHLYRNKIVTLAMWTKYNFYKSQGEKYYPSDEHYLKLKIPGSDIRPDQFSHRKTRWGEAHELELLFRNYNVEIEAALIHIKDDSVDDETKECDFRTLDFKTGFLSKHIVDFIEKERVETGLDRKVNWLYKKVKWLCRKIKWFGKRENRFRKGARWLDKKVEWVDKKINWFYDDVSAEEEAFATIKKRFERSMAANPDKSKYENKFGEELRWLLDFKENRIDSFASIFNANSENEKKFREYLYLDTLLECGRNTIGDEIIHMIRRVNTK
jgi:hypothetical protein